MRCSASVSDAIVELIEAPASHDLHAAPRPARPHGDGAGARGEVVDLFPARVHEQLALAREQERRRLGRDLHDGVGPSLAALALALENARAMVRADPDGVESLLEQAAIHARETVGDVRRIVYALHPPSLENRGLVAALGEQASRLALSGLQVSVHAAGDLSALPANLEAAGHWIVFEALGNVIRHSGARHADVRIARTPDAVTIRVGDDGKGMDLHARRGLGVRSMRERAQELGGSLEIATAVEGGTEITAILPLKRS